ncbi:MAG: hypothetical protein FJ137_06095 [Deltaproteobacteria bacterium]|nr:hypothetical protein [Deltaproteobacteria bacterium]
MPLLLHVTLAAGAPRAVVADECATLGVLAPGLSLARGSLAVHLGVARARLALYDERHFAQKKGPMTEERKGQPTRQYARTIARRDPAPAQDRGYGGPRLDAVVVEAGPCAATIASLSTGARVALPDGEADAAPARHGRLDVVTFANMVPLTVVGDGLRYGVVVDERRLAAHAAPSARRGGPPSATLPSTPRRARGCTCRST